MVDLFRLLAVHTADSSLHNTCKYVYVQPNPALRGVPFVAEVSVTALVASGSFVTALPSNPIISGAEEMFAGWG